MKNISPKSLQIGGVVVSILSAALSLAGSIISSQQQSLEIKDQVTKALAEQASKVEL